jgi:predicted DCC family thiol-disulfide oxidoreductase YuxK
MANDAANPEKYFILFDSDCKLCNNTVWFIKRNDSEKIFNFIPVKSAEATEYLNRYDTKNVKSGSLMLIKEDKIYLKSSAVLHVLKCLDGLWPLLYAFIIVPRFIRDAVYGFIARNRYKWFGDCKDCDNYGLD